MEGGRRPSTTSCRVLGLTSRRCLYHVGTLLDSAIHLICEKCIDEVEVTVDQHHGEGKEWRYWND